jgi:hypothetical protein
MAQPLVTMPAHVSAAGSPATAFVTTNSRVRSALGALGLVTDALQFAGPLVAGTWAMGNSRVKVNGLPTVGVGSTGVATGAAGATGPVTVLGGDPRVGGS